MVVEQLKLLRYGREQPALASKITALLRLVLWNTFEVGR